MKPKKFTVVAHCSCGCDQNELYHVRAGNGAAAAENVRSGVADPGEDSPIAGRNVEILAVFSGHLEEQAGLL